MSWLGIDIGGTDTKAAVVALDSAGHPRLLAERSWPTGAAEPPERALARLAERAGELVARCEPVQGAGLTVPGLYDESTGTLELLPNFPRAWWGAQVRRPFEQALGRDVQLINDARAFTLAETRAGAARGAATVACVTLGTGVGGGVVIDGVLRGGRAGEIGHQVVVLGGAPCGCGNAGCVEAYCTAGALVRASGCTGARETFVAAAGGDARAERAVAGFVSALAAGIGNVLTVLRPECVVIGGGVATAGEALLAPLRTALVSAAPLVPSTSYRVVGAALGRSAGAIGAAMWARERRALVSR